MHEKIQYEIIDNTLPEALNDLLDTILVIGNEHFCDVVFDENRDKRIAQINQYIKGNSTFESLIYAFILNDQDFVEAKVAWICNYYNKIQNKNTILYVTRCFFELCAIYWIKYGKEIESLDKKFIFDHLQFIVPEDKISLHDIDLSLKCIEEIKFKGSLQESVSFILDHFSSLVNEFKRYIESIPSEKDERILENNINFLRLKEELRECIQNDHVFEDVFEEIMREYKNYMTEKGIFVALNGLIKFISTEDIKDINNIKTLIECRLEINSTYKWPVAYSFQFSLEAIWKFIKLYWFDECPSSEEVLFRFNEVYESCVSKQLYFNKADEIYAFFHEEPRKFDASYSSLDEG